MQGNAKKQRKKTQENAGKHRKMQKNTRKTQENAGKYRKMQENAEKTQENTGKKRMEKYGYKRGPTFPSD